MAPLPEDVVPSARDLLLNFTQWLVNQGWNASPGDLQVRQDDTNRIAVDRFLRPQEGRRRRG